MSTSKKTVKPATKTTTKKVSTAAKETIATPAKVGAMGADPMRKKELIEQVVSRSGMKKKDVKPVVEAMLAELGETLAKGRGLILPPLGRVMVNREKEMPDGRVLIVKVKQKDKIIVATASAETPAET